MKRAIFAACILLGGVPAAATVVAESFETPAYAPSTIIYGPDQSGTYGTNPGGGSAGTASLTFGGFSGVIGNTTPVFVDTTAGTQAAFLQGYQGNGSQIDWSIAGLIPGGLYTLSFATAGSLVVPAEAFGVSIFGAAPVLFAPSGTAYTTNAINFTASAASGVISFIGAVNANNAATALDALDVSFVPEPASWALLIAGFAITGTAMRRRAARPLAA